MKMIVYLVATAISLGVLVINEMSKNEELAEIPFFVGTYTKGESKGIYNYSLKSDGTIKQLGLAFETENPSYLAITDDKKYLVSVNEVGEGMIESFLIEEDKTLKLISQKPSGGEYPCFVAVNKEGYVLNSNYGNGTIGLLKINSKGELIDLLDVQQHTGSGVSSRQKSPHAHSVWFRNDGENIVSIDLGTNELWFSKIDKSKEKLTPQNPDKLAMPPGAGPRHMAFYPGEKWAYVLNELTSTVTLIEKTSTNSFQMAGSISTLPEGYDKPNTCADIHLSSDGKFLYASNRGHDSIVIFRVDQENGSLTLVGHENTRGESPRNFSLSPDNKFLLVANQKTNTIVSFRRDKKAGTLKFVEQVAAPSPVCILF